jgi:hypothetical protein
LLLLNDLLLSVAQVYTVTDMSDVVEFKMSAYYIHVRYLDVYDTQRINYITFISPLSPSLDVLHPVEYHDLRYSGRQHNNKK